MLPPLWIGGVGALASAAAAWDARRRRKKAADALRLGPSGAAVRDAAELADGESELARLAQVLVTSRELTSADGADGADGASSKPLRNLFDSVVVTSERVLFSVDHAEHEGFHSATSQAELCVDLSAISSRCVATRSARTPRRSPSPSRSASPRDAFFTCVFSVSPDYDHQEGFTLQLHFATRRNREVFVRAVAAARLQWINGANWWRGGGSGGRSRGLSRTASLTRSISRSLLDSAEPEPEPEGAQIIGNLLRVVSAAPVRSGPAPDSPQLGVLIEEELIRVLEVEMIQASPKKSLFEEGKEENSPQKLERPTHQQLQYALKKWGSNSQEFHALKRRYIWGVQQEEAAQTPEAKLREKEEGLRGVAAVRFQRGWACLRSEDGRLLLTAVDPTAEVPQVEEMAETVMEGRAGVRAARIRSQAFSSFQYRSLSVMSSCATGGGQPRGADVCAGGAGAAGCAEAEAPATRAWRRVRAGA